MMDTEFVWEQVIPGHWEFYRLQPAMKPHKLKLAKLVRHGGMAVEWTVLLPFGESVKYGGGSLIELIGFVESCLGVRNEKPQTLSARDLRRNAIRAVLAEHGPMKFRKVEAHLVLRDMEATTYEVSRALEEMVDAGEIMQGDDFQYRLKETQ